MPAVRQVQKFRDQQYVDLAHLAALLGEKDPGGEYLLTAEGGGSVAPAQFTVIALADAYPLRQRDPPPDGIPSGQLAGSGSGYPLTRREPGPTHGSRRLYGSSRHSAPPGGLAPRDRPRGRLPNRCGRFPALSGDVAAPIPSCGRR